jgi:hypothetical protein
MQTAGSPSHLKEHNDTTPRLVSLVTAAAVATNLRSNLAAEGPYRRNAPLGEPEYRAALTEMAALHATWWGWPTSAPARRWALASQVETACAIEEARRALLEIGDAPWGERLIPAKEIRGWLHLIDNPGESLLNLSQLPPTLIYGDEPGGNLFDKPGIRRGQVVSGPAPYDVACFYSASRWWYGRLPMGRVEMRNWYLERLNERLGMECLDRYCFDLGFDAALAWRFATRWLPFIAEHHATLLARAAYLRATVIEPAWASLRRSS